MFGLPAAQPVVVVPDAVDSPLEFGDRVAHAARQLDFRPCQPAPVVLVGARIGSGEAAEGLRRALAAMAGREGPRIVAVWRPAALAQPMQQLHRGLAAQLGSPPGPDGRVPTLVQALAPVVEDLLRRSGRQRGALIRSLTAARVLHCFTLLAQAEQQGARVLFLHEPDPGLAPQEQWRWMRQARAAWSDGALVALLPPHAAGAAAACLPHRNWTAACCVDSVAEATDTLQRAVHQGWRPGADERFRVMLRAMPMRTSDALGVGLGGPVPSSGPRDRAVARFVPRRTAPP